MYLKPCSSILRMLYPIGLIIVKIFRLNEDTFKRLFIRMNNRISFSKIKNRNMDTEKILVILPHCLQDSECNYRITGNKIENCRSCGKCVIAEIKKIKEEMSLNIEIATGG